MIESTEATSAGIAAGVAGVVAGAGVAPFVAGFCPAVSGGCGVAVFVWDMIVLVVQDKIKQARTNANDLNVMLLDSANDQLVAH